MATADAPAVTVVIPTHGQAPHLAGQLRALARQRTAVPFEVIVADNGLARSALAVVAGFLSRLDLRVVDATGRRGRSFARNQGARSARARALLFLDHDDEAAPGYVDAMARALQRHAVVAARLDPHALNPPWLAGRHWASSVTMPTPPPGLPPWAPGTTLGIDRGALEEVGGFDEELRLGYEDIDLCWRLHGLGYRIAPVHDAVLRYRLRARPKELVMQARRDTVGALRLARKHPDYVLPSVTLGTYLRYAGGSLLRAGAGVTPQVRIEGWSGLGICLGLAERALHRRRLRP
jgi:GT2 family glycosyltransferase